MECGSTYKMHYVGPAEDPHSHDHGHGHHGASYRSLYTYFQKLIKNREPLPQAEEHGRLPQARVHAHLSSKYPESIELVLYLYGPCSIVGIGEAASDLDAKVYFVLMCFLRCCAVRSPADRV